MDAAADPVASCSGGVAGYAIAVPVGAMAVLVVDAGLTAGFRTGFAAGLGMSSGDLPYAIVAVFVGAAIATGLEPWETALALASAAVLTGFAVLLALRARRLAGAGPAEPPPARPARTYARFLGLTIVNPPTIALFAAIVVGMGADALPGIDDRGASRMARGCGRAWPARRSSRCSPCAPRSGPDTDGMLL